MVNGLPSGIAGVLCECAKNILGRASCVLVPRLLSATQDSDLFVRAAARLKKKIVAADFK